ncbi:hypothetical protein B0T14DRAFT_530968 [Immersiella caudata]|uniref:Uncharacterized protein n=1 Tax=Immersiella caudata TaxID=314043 RepID=A0AA39WC41_9PEZI|nr:hypothetical protein B0T14DRAFT_530968 [Immersiella caudata]
MPPAALRRADRTVIPGPGLPSLESLGITSDDLYDETWLAQNTPSLLNTSLGDSSSTPGPNRLHRRVSCLPRMNVDKANARACLAYLTRAGNTNGCGTRVPGTPTACPPAANGALCSAGCAQITGCAYRTIEAVSACSDVAYGGHVIMRECSREGDFTSGGHDVAWGNGNFIVGFLGCR